jgi:glycine/D-amino acid oxidase-like deaminating enzyme
MKIRRRHFLAGGIASAAALAAVPWLRRSRPRVFPGRIVGANHALGHRLRTGDFPAPVGADSTGIVIVGGGVAGLAAARRLQQRGFNDFLLLELDSRPGGNSASGRNVVSAYPWGAHYLPLPGSGTAEITRLLEELGVITGRDASGRPFYREEFLCADPMERLFLDGTWQEGVIPQLGVREADRRQMDSFLARMAELKSARGRDGRRAFAIPVDESSRDPEFLALDRISMAEYLRAQGWDAVPLRWYVDYCCRDDYGAGLEAVSAWAGVHYFAARDAVAANAPPHAVLTWPEGNGWLVAQMAMPFRERIRARQVVFHVAAGRPRASVESFDAGAGRSRRLEARGVILAVPQFVARRLVPEAGVDLSGLHYSPWMVANLTLDELPQGSGAALAWDNVLYRSRSLGYVVATHQHLDPFPRNTVLTYYQPLDAGPPPAERSAALACPHADWCHGIVADLTRAHPDLAAHLHNIDVCVWGHGMIRPVPGFLWGGQRPRLSAPHGNVVFAHSDLSGISIFEEAYIRGIRAADDLLRQLG